jgi:hypothetical protein
VFFFGDPAVGVWGALTMGTLGVVALMRSTRAN